MKTAKISSCFFLLPAFAAVSCGSDSKRVDAGKDQRVLDVRVDSAVEPDEGVEFDLAPFDGLSDDAPADAAPDVAADLSTDGPVPDAPPATNAACANASQLTLTGGKATTRGDTSGFADEFATLECTATGDSSSTVLDGPQAYYKFSGQQDQWYRIILDPSFLAYLYVFTNSSCAAADIQTDCQSQGKTGESSSAISAGQPEAVYFKPPATGDVFVAVDSSHLQDAGTFELTIEEISAPTNGTCAQASPLTFTAGTAEARGDTDAKLTPNEFPESLPWEGVTCGSSSAFEGPQAYYTFDAAADKAYQITLSAEAAAPLYAYVFSSTCVEAEIESACASFGDTGDVLVSSSSSGTAQPFFFMPETPGSYTVAVDSLRPIDAGPFSLSIEEVTPAANTSCATATPITLTAGKGSATGSTVLAKNEFGLDITCGLGGSIVGPQVYFEFDAQANKGYRITLNPANFISFFYTFQKASCGAGTAIDTDCSSGTTGAVWGPVFSTTEGTMYFQPAAAGKYLIAVDSEGNAFVGDFALSIEEVDLPGNSTCSAATPITLNNGEATINATTGFSPDEYSGLTCSASGDSLDGPQLYYSLTMQPDRFYELRLTPSFYDGYLYVFSSATCSEAALTSDCSSKGATGAVTGPVGFSTASLYYLPATAGSYKIGVDSALSTQYADEFGDFILDVTERAAAANGTCAEAKALTLTNNAVTEQGYNVLVPNEFGTTVTCGPATNFEAGQVYYKVDLTGGTEYLFKVFPDFDAQIYLFPAEADGSCPAAADISTACGGSTGGYAAVDAGDKGGIIFTPPADGSYYIAVDGESAQDIGGFKLVIDTRPTNQTCSSPLDLPLTTSPVSIAGDTSLGVSNDLDVSCDNTLGPWPGPQLYYKVSLQQSVAYSITVKQVDWDPALFAFPASVSCINSDVDLACTNPTPFDPDNIYNSDSIGILDETIKIKPAADEDWIIVVDSFDDQGFPNGRGPFTLEVSW